MSNTPSDEELLGAYDSVPAHGDATATHVAGLRAVLARWGSPQPVVREQLTANQVSGLAESAGYWHGDMSRADFINGIRYAEAAHGITQKGGS